jgi:hypothetical protein
VRVTGWLEEPSVDDPAEVEEHPAAIRAMAAAIPAETANAVERFIAVLLSKGTGAPDSSASWCELFL